VKLYRETLTPQMQQYDDFDDRAETRWLPYLMYFQRANYRSDVINTDRLGFRMSHGKDDRASLASSIPEGPVRLLAGASSALGIGASNDATTIPSLLWSRYAPRRPWLNFAGRSYNSAQELLLYVLYRHLLPQVEEIVVFGGFNNLALAQLPPPQQGDNGAFFFCGDFLEQMEELKNRLRKEKAGFGRRADKPASVFADDTPIPELSVLVSNAVEYFARHMEILRLLAEPAGTRISYVLQPLSPWWREEPAPQEQLLFSELDRISKFGTFEKLYGRIASPQAGKLYSEAMRVACQTLEVRFLDLNPMMAAEAKPQDWIYVDRAHYTDEGHDLVTRLVAEGLGLT
jgi:hypothetical protein